MQPYFVPYWYSSTVAHVQSSAGVYYVVYFSNIIARAHVHAVLTNDSSYYNSTCIRILLQRNCIRVG
eukprot:COSAG02_NODE_3934_length_6023_cov_2.093011_2_plen_67_part_00